ncbi:hypothetical protein JTB14_003033 [Gonioctena quinquepunctata]|nr:hypothetical protein JTB14_003033 [Gonioctena quinquepunctata]
MTSMILPLFDYIILKSCQYFVILNSCKLLSSQSKQKHIMATANVPQNSLKDLRCSICKKCLSVPPIFSSQDGTKNKCGRCKYLVEKGICARNMIYENMAQCHSFPCIYKHCNRTIPWGEVEQHEKECPRRTLRCPLTYRNCFEKFEIDQLHNHMTEVHRRNISYDSQFTHIFSSLSSAAYHIVLGDETFFIFIFCEPRSIFYEERIHCFACTRRECSLKHHQFSKHYRSNFPTEHLTMIDSNTVNSFFDRPQRILISITFIPEKARNMETDEPLVEANANDNSETIRNLTECPICNEFFVRPIFMCHRGHLLCHACKTSLRRCPSCTAPVDNMRCYAIESFGDNVRLACQYKKNGCEFIGNVSLLRAHEQSCSRKE